MWCPIAPGIVGLDWIFIDLSHTHNEPFQFRGELFCIHRSFQLSFPGRQCCNRAEMSMNQLPLEVRPPFRAVCSVKDAESHVRLYECMTRMIPLLHF